MRVEKTWHAQLSVNKNTFQSLGGKSYLKIRRSLELGQLNDQLINSVHVIKGFGFLGEGISRKKSKCKKIRAYDSFNLQSFLTVTLSQMCWSLEKVRTNFVSSFRLTALVGIGVFGFQTSKVLFEVLLSRQLSAQKFLLEHSCATTS